MPADNVWLTHRTAERDALLRLLATMRATPGRAVQGAGTPQPALPQSTSTDPPPEDPAMTDTRRHASTPSPTRPAANPRRKPRQPTPPSAP